MTQNILDVDGKTIKVLDVKPRFDLIDPHFTLGLACTLTHGAAFYAPYSRQNVPEEHYRGALERHYNAYNRHDIYDPKSHLFHLDHLAACTMFLRWKLMQNPEINMTIMNTINQGLYIPTKGADE